MPDLSRAPGSSTAPATVKVRIPAGVEDGQRIRVKGRGAAGRANGPAGDLYVVVHVDRHALFGRRGRNLTLDRPRHLPRGGPGHDHHRAHPRRARHPAGPAGHAVGPDLPGEGPRACPAGKTAGTGDLLVTVEVAVPEEADRRTAGRRRGAGQGGRAAAHRDAHWGCDDDATIHERRAPCT